LSLLTLTKITREASIAAMNAVKRGMSCAHIFSSRGSLPVDPRNLSAVTGFTDYDKCFSLREFASLGFTMTKSYVSFSKPSLILKPTL
jgi:hypothetical protein